MMTPQHNLLYALLGQIEMSEVTLLVTMLLPNSLCVVSNHDIYSCRPVETLHNRDNNLSWESK